MTMTKTININKLVAARREERAAEKAIRPVGSIPDAYREAAVKRLHEARDVVESAGKPLNDALDDLQRRCHARIIGAINIADAIIAVEDRLEISKKAMRGIKVKIDIHGQTFPGAYKGIPESTWFEAECKSTGWVITDIYRALTAGSSSGYQVTLTDEAKAAVIEKMQTW